MKKGVDTLYAKKEDCDHPLKYLSLEGIGYPAYYRWNKKEYSLNFVFHCDRCNSNVEIKRVLKC